MKQGFALCALFSVALIFAACDSGSDSTDAASPATDPSTSSPNTPTTPSTPTVTSEQLSLTLTFQGPTVSPSTVYACWIEDESGKNVQNVYVCNSLVGIGKTLTGDAIPYWKTVKYKELAAIDGVTGASIQGKDRLSISRTIPIGSPAKFRACFEIDRSLNDNKYFSDRPSFIYKSSVIDAASLSSDPYSLTLAGWMSNDTGIGGGSYSQQPKSGVTISGYAPYAYMTDLSWIAPVDDMVSLLTVRVTKP
jgi:hypothetical protein